MQPNPSQPTDGRNPRLTLNVGGCNDRSVSFQRIVYNFIPFRVVVVCRQPQLSASSLASLSDCNPPSNLADTQDSTIRVALL